MDLSQWEFIKSLVDHSLILSGKDRDDFIKEVCNDYPSISSDVIELLECIEKSEKENFLNNAWNDYKNVLLNKNPVDIKHGEHFINKEIGPYRISKLLGHGGMGIVFKATRIDGEFRRDVAIKMIRPFVHIDESLARLQIEKEILAKLQHPHIAQLYDAGMTTEGLPYLVMEYVDGVPIEEYCNKNKCKIDERLSLIKDVCSAVHYAHKNLIVHRDLKSQNIYVDKNGNVKILDFGIAKLLTPRNLAFPNLKTIQGQKIWTPHYASPEQIKGKSITIQTDIYALGILLYRILTGSYPFNLKDKTLSEIEDIIINSSPLLPSQVIMRISDTDRITSNRKTKLPLLRNKLSGDIDALVCKAIRKEPEYRYHSVAQLSDDIDRYKAGIPLIARKGTLRYKTGKFIRRNKVGLMIAGTFLFFIVGFTGLYSFKITEERNKAQQERDKLEQVLNFMTGLLESGNPAESPGGALTAEMLLEKGIKQANVLKKQPAVQARIFNVAGNVYLMLGKFERAETLFSKSVNIYKQKLSSDILGLTKSMNNLSIAYTRQGRYQMAANMYEKSLGLQIEKFGNNHPEIAETLSLFGAWIPVSNIHNAAEMRKKSLQIRRTFYGDYHLKVADSYEENGRIKRALGLPKEAIKDYQKALHIRKTILGPSHPDVANVMILLGDIYNLYEIDKDSAEMIYNNALQLLYDKTELYHPQLLHVLGSYADLLSKKGNNQAAQQMIEQSVGIRRTVYGPNHPKTADGLNQLAEFYYKQNNYEQAVRLYKNSLKIKEEKLGNNHLALVGILRDLANTLIALEKYSEAEMLLIKALKIHTENDITKGLTIGVLANLKAQEGDLDKAGELYQRALNFYAKHGLSNHYDALNLKDKFDELIN